ncbi:MAG TPA: peptidoglycan-associated lipoprotein Pal [Gallionellaceae bacterium]|nr:peptidoglycan-associated lipoprotein Pal [Gallionellaceae bacterium]
MKKLTISVLLVSLLAACASNKPAEVAAPAAASEAPAATPVAEAAKEVAPAATDALDDASSILAKRSAFFDFDKSAVKAEDKPAVQAHGQYLATHANRKVVVEGNADERGSSEYNLALGNRRAESVKKMLIVSGAKASQISTASFGEEKPRATGHNEAAWSQNRRADIVYK